MEQTFGTLILHRRLVRDYEHRPASSASRVYWAMTHIMARRLTDASTLTWRDPQVAGVNLNPLLQALDLQEDAARALAGDLRTQVDTLQTY